MKKALCLFIFLLSLLTFTACKAEAIPAAEKTPSLTIAAADTDITLNGTQARVDGSGAVFSDGVVTVSNSGTYHITGTGDGIVIRVEAGESADVVLSLEGADLTVPEGEAIRTEGTGSVSIVMAEGTENSISSSAD